MPPKDTKKKEETAVATVQQGETALAPATAAGTFATMDGYKAEDTRGKEGIESTDLRLPFLSLAQKTSKALDQTEDSYIPGLQFGDMYNSETKEIYGKEPVRFIPLRHRKRAYLPDENGRMGETIEWNDRRCDWPDEKGKKAWEAAGKKGKPKPEGVRVYDWVVLLMLESGPQLAVISFKSKSFAAGQSLTTFVSMVKGPAFTAQYKIISLLDSNDAGKFAKFGVMPFGKPSPEEAQFAEGVYESVKDKTIATDETIEDEPGAHDGPSTVDGTVVTEKKKDDIPF